MANNNFFSAEMPDDSGAALANLTPQQMMLFGQMQGKNSPNKAPMPASKINLSYGDEGSVSEGGRSNNADELTNEEVLGIVSNIKPDGVFSANGPVHDMKKRYDPASGGGNGARRPLPEYASNPAYAGDRGPLARTVGGSVHNQPPNLPAANMNQGIGPSVPSSAPLMNNQPPMGNPMMAPPQPQVQPQMQPQAQMPQQLPPELINQLRTPVVSSKRKGRR